MKKSNLTKRIIIVLIIVVFLIIVPVLAINIIGGLRGHYDAKFELGDSIRQSLVGNYSSIEKCEISEVYRFGKTLGQISCSVYVASEDDLNAAEEMIRRISSEISRKDELYDYLLKNIRVFSVFFHVHSSDSWIISVDTFRETNFEVWSVSGDGAEKKVIRTPMTEQKYGTVLINKVKSILCRVNTNSHTAGFIVPLKETLAAIGVNVEEKDGLILVQGRENIIEIDPKKCSYQMFEDEEDLRKHNGQYDYLSDELPEADNQPEKNSGFYPWLYCEYSENELFVDHMTMQFLLRLADVDESIKVEWDYSKRMLTIDAI